MSDYVPEDGWHQYDAMMQEADMAGTIEQQRAEIERLRAALKAIASCERRADGDVVDIARRVLGWATPEVKPSIIDIDNDIAD